MTSEERIEQGEVIELNKDETGVSRREVFKAVGVAGGVILGLKKLIRTAYANGRPERVRIVPQEYYRRL